jgi:hydroxymethylpyrimidine kinase / phosphomethylpyrimidine kinase / thiamine-phosphate diphosphorylase
VEAAAAELLAFGCGAVLIKGGHVPDSDGAEGRDASPVAQDYLSDGKESCWLSSPRLQSAETHGTGCTLSSAITALLAQGYPLSDAVVLGKAYVHQGIRAASRLGLGPVSGRPPQARSMLVAQ